MKATLLLLITMTASSLAASADAPPAPSKVIPLDTAAGPGTEVDGALPNGTHILRNITHASLSIFPADPAKANGTAMIIAPGGGFHFLSIDSEGTQVAAYLNKLGVTCFVLKYRTVPTGDDYIQQLTAALDGEARRRELIDRVSPHVLEDGQAAVRHVREHAAQYHVDPHRIGLMGFSAGGFVALMIALHHDAGSRPDFVAPIYPLAPAEVAPTDRIPLFVLCADDDPTLSPIDHSVRAYEAWHRAHFPAELHIFTSGGHGFGMKTTGSPTDGWIDLLVNWLRGLKLVAPAP
jgi:acetyl esterase/lipase